VFLGHFLVIAKPGLGSTIDRREYLKEKIKMGVTQMKKEHPVDRIEKEKAELERHGWVLIPLRFFLCSSKPCGTTLLQMQSLIILAFV
jgi:hypothetical protein